MREKENLGIAAVLNFRATLIKAMGKKVKKRPYGGELGRNEKEGDNARRNVEGFLAYWAGGKNSKGKNSIPAWPAIEGRADNSNKREKGRA